MDTLQNIPVFVYPTLVKFFLASRATHKQLVSLYNPYEFPVRFKVLCTAPSKYSVIDPEGAIGPQCCVDIVIRHNVPLPAHCNVTDKFRISMQDHTTKKFLGKKDIEVVLLPGEADNVSNDGGDNFHALPYERSNDEQRSNIQFPSSIMRMPAQSTPYMAIIAGIFCIFALLLPTQPECKEDETNIPTYLHLSVNLKLVFAYVLGLVSFVVLRLQ